VPVRGGASAAHPGRMTDTARVKTRAARTDDAELLRAANDFANTGFA
jgi:hypothetical protein